MTAQRVLLHTVAASIILLGGRAMACPLCANSFRLTISAQELVYAEHSVLAMPVANRNEFQVVAVIKGDTPAGNTIPTGDVFRPETKSEKTVLLIRDDHWRQWVNFGPVSGDQAHWLRKLSATKRTIEMNDAEWREHVAYFQSYLENSEPMVAEIAYNEFVSAPYGALRSLKPRLDAATIRAWLKDSKLAKRRAVYLLLLGIAGTEQDASWLEERIDSARKKHDLTNLPALLGADLELRGLSAIEQTEKLYLDDSSRTKMEIEAALVALKIHGETDSVSRDRVKKAFNCFVKQNPSLAGLVTVGLGQPEIRIAPVSASP